MRFRKLLAAALAIPAAAVPAGLVLADAPDAQPSIVTTLRPTLGRHADAEAVLHGGARGRLAHEHLRLARRYDDLTGRHTARAASAAGRSVPTARLRAANRELRHQVRQLDVRIPPELQQIAECESHGDPRAIGGGGQYRGRYQMTVSSWHSVGGRGDPVDAPAEEQDRRAALLLAGSGRSQWPVCGA